MRNYFLRAPPCEAQPQPTPLGAAPQKAAGPRHGPDGASRGAAGGRTGRGAAAVRGGSAGQGAGGRGQGAGCWVRGAGTGSRLLPRQSCQPQAAARLPRPACPAVPSQPAFLSTDALEAFKLRDTKLCIFPNS